MSPEKRHQKAKNIRKTTSKSTQRKSSSILDVNQQSVEESLKSEGVSFDSAQETSFLIHGHTHRPAEHDFIIANQDKKRIVLGDWGEKWSYLKWNAEGEYKLSF